MLEIDFFEEYKKLDKLCERCLLNIFEQLEGNKRDLGVTKYIQKLDSVPKNDQSKIDSWDVFYRRMKRVRGVRNKLAHDVGTFGADVCQDNDLIWVKNFVADFMEGVDPVTILYGPFAEERKVVMPQRLPAPCIREQINIIGKEKHVLHVGDAIEVETHAKLLNRLLGKNYKGYMSCVYKLDADNLIWMIRLNDKLSKEGWCNSLREKGERVTENYLGEDYERLPSHKETVFRQTRYIFDILEDDNGNRKYVFRGVFKFAVNEGSNDYRVWRKIANEWDITKFKNS